MSMFCASRPIARASSIGTTSRPNGSSDTITSFRLASASGMPMIAIARVIDVTRWATASQMMLRRIRRRPGPYL